MLCWVQKCFTHCAKTDMDLFDLEVPMKYAPIKPDTQMGRFWSTVPAPFALTFCFWCHCLELQKRISMRYYKSQLVKYEQRKGMAFSQTPRLTAENQDISWDFSGTIWPRELMLMSKRSECRADFRKVSHIAPRQILTYLTWKCQWNMHRSSPIPKWVDFGPLCQHHLQ